MNEPPSGVRRIDHIGVAVRDLTAASRFLTALMHMQEAEPVDLPDQGVRVQFHEAGGDQIELLQPTRADGALARFLDQRGEGLHHICFEVDDVETELRRLEAVGVELVDLHAWLSPHGYAAFVHPRAWHGVSIELRQKVPPTGISGSKR